MPAQPLLPNDPRRLGSFMLVGRLGEGGQGIVYLGLAEDGRQVAVKILKTGTDERARTRLSQEIAAAMRVRAFCTARVLDSAVDGPRPYIVSEFVDGPSLQDRVDQRGPLLDGDLDRLIVNTATALTAIHSARIVHRDLKPANVLLGPDGPRVVDFGISRPADQHTMSGQLIGTPAYFSPEQLRRLPATPASDVFAWAGTMVFAATGQPPFGQGDIAGIFEAILRGEPDLTGVPEHVRGLLAACLDKDPGRRPTAKEILSLLLDSDSGLGPGESVDPEVTRAAEDLLDALVPGAASPPPAGAVAREAGEAGEAGDAGEAGGTGPGGTGSPERIEVEGTTGDRSRDGEDAEAERARDGAPDGPPDGEEPAGDGAGTRRDGQAAPAAQRPVVRPGTAAPARPRAHETVTPERSTVDTQPGAPARRPDPVAPAAPAAERRRRPEPVANQPVAHEPGPRPPAREDAVTPPGSAAVAPGPAGPGSGDRSRQRRPLLLLSAGIAAVVIAAGGLLALRSLGGPDLAIPAAYAGTWSGDVYESGGITSRTVATTVTLESGTDAGRLSVPDAGCAGDLALTEVTHSGLTMRLTMRSGDCPQGKVTAYLQSGVLVYRLETGGVTSNGELRRTG